MKSFLKRGYLSQPVRTHPSYTEPEGSFPSYHDSSIGLYLVPFELGPNQILKIYFNIISLNGFYLPDFATKISFSVLMSYSVIPSLILFGVY